MPLEQMKVWLYAHTSFKWAGKDNNTNKNMVAQTSPWAV